MMNVFYHVKDALYVNLTNRCPCACTFCIRNNGDGAYGSDSLWLEREPTKAEISADLDKLNLDSYKEIVFCGYGEPTEALELLIYTASEIRRRSKTKIRINTNGLSDLINKKPTAKLLEGLLDVVSISLNAPTAEEYMMVTRPSFGAEAFDAMLSFASECKDIFPQVMFTVVDVITTEQIERCKKLSEDMGIPLRVRGYDS